MALEKKCRDWSFVCNNTQGTGTENILNKVFGGEVVAEMAAKNDPGLQLLMMNVCNITKDFALPESLRFLFLSNE